MVELKYFSGSYYSMVASFLGENKHVYYNRSVVFISLNDLFALNKNTAWPVLGCPLSVLQNTDGIDVIDFVSGRVEFCSPVVEEFVRVSPHVLIARGRNDRCLIYSLDGELLHRFRYSVEPQMISEFGVLSDVREFGEKSIRLYDLHMSEEPIHVWDLELELGGKVETLPAKNMNLVQIRGGGYVLLNLVTGESHVIEHSLNILDICACDGGIVGVSDKCLYKFNFSGEIVEEHDLQPDEGGAVYVNDGILYFCKNERYDPFSGEKRKVNIFAYDFSTMKRIGSLPLPRASRSGGWAKFGDKVSIKLSCWGDNNIVEHDWLLTFDNDDWLNGTPTPEFETWHVDFKQKMIAKNRSEYVVTPPTNLSFGTLVRQMDVASWKVCGVAAKTSGKDNWDKTFTGKLVWDLSSLELTDVQREMLSHLAEETADSINCIVYAPVKRAEITIECVFESDKAEQKNNDETPPKPLIELTCDTHAEPVIHRVPSNRKGNITFDALTDEGGLEARIEELMVLAGDELDFSNLEITYAGISEMRFETANAEHLWHITLDPTTVTDGLLAALQTLVAEHTQGELRIGNAPDGWFRAAFNKSK